MRSKLLVYFLMAMLPAGFALGCAYEGEVVHKIFRERPDTSLPGTEGVHAFIFRGPTGTSRRPITLPGPEFWSWEPSGKYAFYLRDRQGNGRWQLVTPEVFACYEVGDYFNDSQSNPPCHNRYSKDSKTVQAFVYHRKTIAQVRRKTHACRSPRALAKHFRHHRSNRIAQR
jgi:hypothetical protein